MSTDLLKSHQFVPQLTTTTATEPLTLSTTTESRHHRQKAWHLFALLLSIGGPTPMSFLASRCTLFRASPELIQFLCSIPSSPISLTSDKLYATLSLSSLSAFAKSLSNFGFTVDVFAPWIRDPLNCTSRKRKRVVFYSEDEDEDEDEEEQGLVPLSKRIRNDCAEVYYHLTDNISRNTYTQPSGMSVVASQLMIKFPLFVGPRAGQLSCNLKDIEHVQTEMHMNMFVQRKASKQLMASKPDLGSALPTRILDHENIRSSVNSNTTYFLEDNKQCAKSSLEVDDACEAKNIRTIENKKLTEDGKEEQLNNSDSLKRTEKLFLPFNISVSDMLTGREFDSINRVNCNDKTPSLSKGPPTTQEHAVPVFPAVLEKRLLKPSVKTKTTQRDAVASKVQDLCKSLVHSKAVNTPQEKQHCSMDQVSISITQKSRQNHNDMQLKERKGNSTSLLSKEPTKQKILPDFESFSVEEEEGSGGYGTVYRARRKNDETTVAIKCPHANAHRHHVNNELRMLERFGGKNFVIKYEGCFKSGSCDCFVLEHVEHDRPEVLKKEIDVFQLQSYGYCMFRALASLHKQGIVHRDVKPGNFLFSRKTNKGYLIDFNLAMDLHQKYKTINKSKQGHFLSSNHVTLRNTKSVLPTSSRKSSIAKSLNAVNHEATKGVMSTLAPTSQKKTVVRETNLGRWNQFNSQGADGSGITSAKDVTSTRTPSGERLREPLPCQGRKELISLLQEAMMSPNHEASHVSAPMRKRVAASPGKVNKELLYLTPMPLHSTGLAVAGAGLMKNKGDGKQKKEGHCAGTKGFRAPEVCFRSPHQGPKIDTWSAGVTLLYLMIGRTPFFGDPEQNIKDIAKLRGSEALWEVAKLHNRESSFPQELYDTQFLSSMSIREWCQINTKRRDFLGVIPKSLFDLVDKCLTVNPRLRISSEDALKHEFFAPVNEGLRKQRLLRQGQNLDCGTSHPLHGQGIARPLKISH